MGLRFGLAKATGAALTWGLRSVLRRPAGNMPGKMALYVDPALIGHLRPKLRRGSVVVVGTNGKTTVTNLLADAIEASGQTVMSNRSGANLDSGVATTMLQSAGADWGVFESDELWLARILPQLQANYVVLLNLFRDQEDRMGGIARIQESIAGALALSPRTTLIYTADDPYCAGIAARVANPSVAVGLGEDMGLARLGLAEAPACARCGEPLAYGVRQYDQLGEFSCAACGFARPALDYAAVDLSFGPAGLAFSVIRCGGAEQDASEQAAPMASELMPEQAAPMTRISYAQGAPYLAYNLLSAFVAAAAAGVSASDFQRAADAFDPKNGRLQRYAVGGRSVLLNLAKNPTGFNENLRLVLADEGPKAVAFFVNDKEGDGRDISWIEGVDFEALAAIGAQGEGAQDEGIREDGAREDGASSRMLVFAGGLRREDLAARLRRAGLEARVVDGIADVLALLPESGLPADAGVYAIANYTALPEVKAELDRM